MKATGIVRRIDDLGRVVIPKEIRRTLRIREGDPLEIFTDREGEIILKKYSPIGEFGMPVKLYAESLSQTMGCTVCITDRFLHPPEAAEALSIAAVSDSWKICWIPLSCQQRKGAFQNH